MVFPLLNPRPVPDALPMRPFAADPTPPNRLARRASTALAALLGAALLAACGGSTTQFDPFIAQRVIAVGDDASVITGSGRYYTVNGVKDDKVTVDCTLRPIWTQQVAGLYGFVFAGCNPQNVEVKAFTYAVAGALVRDLGAQIDTVVANGGFRDKDLVLTMAGINDIAEVYRQFPAAPEAALIAEAGERGRQMALHVNRIVGLGGKVIVSSIPDMQFSPLAVAEEAANPGGGRPALLGRLSAAFNERLGVTILLDGRFVGLVQMDLTTQAMARSPVSFGLTDAVNAVCATALPDCTTETLIANTSADTFLWADATRLGTHGQQRLGLLAADRARRNPF
jgi:outer membrane lipase/esterase